jgi:hypothetical protein
VSATGAHDEGSTSKAQVTAAQITTSAHLFALAFTAALGHSSPVGIASLLFQLDSIGASAAVAPTGIRLPSE